MWKLGGNKHDQWDVEGMLEKVLRDLRKDGIVTSQQLVSWHSVVLDPAYVHITASGVAETERIRGTSRKLRCVFCGTIWRLEVLFYRG